MGQNCSQKCCGESDDKNLAFSKAHPAISEDDQQEAHAEKMDEDLGQSTSYFDREVKELNKIKTSGGVANGVTYKFQNGATYKGQWENNMRHGFGCHVWPDGASYEGMWKENCAVGSGRFVHADGDVFIGQWNANMASGFGIYYHKGSTTYKGQWRNDLQDGYGVETWIEGARYEGSFRDGQKDGYGCYYWIDGSVYHGRWVDNIINGEGVYLASDGRCFRGQWKESVINGMGRYNWPGGRAAPWLARRGHAAAVDWASSAVALLGGLAPHSTGEIARSDAWVTRDAGFTWVRQSDTNPWRPRYEHAATFDVAGRLYLSGGLTCSRQTGPCGNGPGQGLLDHSGSDVWLSLDAGQSWSEVAPAAGQTRWSARHAFSFLAERSGNGALFVLGGVGPFGVSLQDVWQSTDGGATWRPRALSADFPARAFHAAAMSPDDTAMFMLGGRDANGSALNDMWVSTDQGRSWSQRAPFPGRRHSFGAVVDAGGSLVILGGIPFTSGVMAAACIT